MAITVSGKNYTQISGCESTSDGGTWTGIDAQDGDNKKEGSYSLCGTLKAAGNNDAGFTPSTAVDLSGTKHVRFWLISTHGALLNIHVSGGIQFYASDGTNTGYWYVGGRDNYPGGWHNFVVDVSKSVDSGTKPASMNAITSMGVRINLTGTAKNVDNLWLDNLSVCDGLITYGDDAGGYYDFDDIFAIDNDPANGGWGIITKKAGVYCLVGSIEFGDASGTNGAKIQAKSQVVVFENRSDGAGTGSLINSNLLNFTIVDNGTGTTEFILGSKSGGAGVEGCTIRIQDTEQLAKFDIDASTDADISDFKLYGSKFLGADLITLPPSGANKEVLNCSFEKCGQVDPDTCVVQNCSFINAAGRGLLIDTAAHQVVDCTFISCGHGVHCPISVSVDFDNLTFSGSNGLDKWDVEHSVAGALTINALNGANPNSSYVEETGAGSTTINNAVNITVYVKDAANDPIQNAQVAVYKTSDDTQLMNEDSDINGKAEESFNYAENTDIYLRVRKSSVGATRYLPVRTTGTITSTGFALTVVLYEDMAI